MIDIILKFPKSTIYFFRFSRQYVNKAVYRHIMCMVLAIIIIDGTAQMSYVVQHEVRMTTIAYLKRALKNGTFNKLEQKLIEKLPLVA